MHNDKSKSKDKCNKECRAKNARRRRDSYPEASHDGASPKESLQKHETLRRNPVRETAEGLDYRFLRSQPRIIGLGLLRRARPRQSDYNANTQLKGPIINASLSALQIHTYAR
jgi:hypothetical protein